MPAALKLAQGDLIVQADFAEPAFHMFRDYWEFAHRVFTKLARHGLRLTDMKFERGSGSIGDGYLLCSLFNFTMAIRFRVEKVEAHCLDLARMDVNRFSQASADALEAVRSHIPNVAFRTYSLGVALHGTIEGISAREFVSKFVTRTPEKLGPPIGTGVVFYYGPEADRLLSALTVDLSAVVSDGVFVRANVVWDGAKIAIGAIREAGEKFVGDVYRRLELEPKWD